MSTDGFHSSHLFIHLFSIFISFPDGSCSTFSKVYLYQICLLYIIIIVKTFFQIILNAKNWWNHAYFSFNENIDIIFILLFILKVLFIKMKKLNCLISRLSHYYFWSSINLLLHLWNIDRFLNLLSKFQRLGKPTYCRERARGWNRFVNCKSTIHPTFPEKKTLYRIFQQWQCLRLNTLISIISIFLKTCLYIIYICIVYCEKNTDLNEQMLRKKSKEFILETNYFKREIQSRIAFSCFNFT